MPDHLHSECQEPRNLKAGPDRERVVSLCSEQLGLLGRKLLFGEDALVFQISQALKL